MNTPGHINNEPIKDFETPSFDHSEKKTEEIKTFAFNKIQLTLNQYQIEAAKNKAFPEKYAIIYPTIGVLNEAGEMAGKIKKWMRGDTPTLDVKDLTSEMGDVLWYLSSLATDLGITLEDVARNNIEKITKRREQGKIKGDGDHREERKHDFVPLSQIMPK